MEAERGPGGIAALDMDIFACRSRWRVFLVSLSSSLGSQGHGHRIRAVPFAICFYTTSALW